MVNFHMEELRRSLPGMAGKGKGNGSLRSNREAPLRAELLSIEQLKRHAVELARRHTAEIKAGENLLLARLDKNEEILLQAFTELSQAVEKQQELVPAAEWLIDNFYLIQEQIRLARKHLPRSYSQQLPSLTRGPLTGYPRVYEIASELIAHSDGRVEDRNLYTFVAGYQTESFLTLGELWAIPIMLRLALIENIRRIASRLINSRAARTEAAYWVNQMSKAVEQSPDNLILVVADMARANPVLNSSFVAEYARLLQGQSAVFVLALTWLEQRLAAEGSSIEQQVRLENQTQAADQVSISNSINSLRFLDGMDWHEFVEGVSVVESILRTDPADVYSRMDFATRDRYRHAVEKLAKFSGQKEEQVAQKAIELARTCRQQNGEDIKYSHVGFYLIGPGISELEKGLGVPLTFCRRLKLWCQKKVFLWYAGSIGVITLALSLFILRAIGYLPLWLAIFTLFLLFVVCSQLAVALTNWMTTLFVKPVLLPRLDFSRGLPPECRTLIVFPVILSDSKTVEQLLENLEVQYLANRDEHIHLGLLTDFKDSFQEKEPEDEVLLHEVKEGIRKLNRRYRSQGQDIFFLFHRDRTWNPKEKCWMGYERKRGKLLGLNMLIQEGRKDAFTLILGEMETLRKVRYVVTLDADCQLPREAVRKMVGCLEHPLNKPRYEEKKQTVVEGYGILQPRVATSLTSANRSLYARFFSGEPGLDPYTRVVSDVYQDLFQEGSFVGKGIYHVETFTRALKERFPDNLILSHDLLEGCYVRCGLISDVQVYENFPARYSADVKRRHRWIRGDWQILAWLFPRVPGRREKWVVNPLNSISRWKIFDNIRRSLFPPFLLLLVLVGWLFLKPVWIWTVLTSGLIFLPLFLNAACGMLQRSREMYWLAALRIAFRSAGKYFIQACFFLVFLPYEAFLSLDAITRTIWRLLITRRGLLQWVTSVESEKKSESNLSEFLKLMWVAPLISIASLVSLTVFSSVSLLFAEIFIWGWLFSPVVAWWLSQPLVIWETGLNEQQIYFLRRVARKTWSFFQTFVNAGTRYLPPDNYQEYPVRRVAYRTSPTNIGLTLLSTLAARDLGYLTGSHFVFRLQQTLNTLQRLKRFRKHFYNWYDLKTLEPLAPVYISTVDSGNLAGHLLVLHQALLEMCDSPIFAEQSLAGLGDTLYVLLEVAGQAEKHQLRQLPVFSRVMRAGWRELTTQMEQPVKSLTGMFSLLEKVKEMHQVMEGELRTRDREVNRWQRLLREHYQSLEEELNTISPWVRLLAERPQNNLWAESVRKTLEKLCQLVDENLPLRKLANLSAELEGYLSDLRDYAAASQASDLLKWLEKLSSAIEKGASKAEQRLQDLTSLAERFAEMADMDWDFLYDRSSRLLSLGYHVAERRKDAIYYDLLASEARLASFVAISLGLLPQEHWFALNRLITGEGENAVLVSWGGSMFEYLMPLLVMPNFRGTLLDQSCQAAVRRQIEYAAERGVPWGISEAAYNAVDSSRNYQYDSFGVPGLGLRAGLAEDLVVAPYASALALMVTPARACQNLQRLRKEGMEGRFGFYESVDYTPGRLVPGQEKAIVRCFMAHHEGMSLVAIANTLLNLPMVRRFRQNPFFRSAELLLQERVPDVEPFQWPAEELPRYRRTSEKQAALMRIFTEPDTPMPEIHLLSNGRYTVMVTNAGGGFSRWQDILLTRWREDYTRDNWGLFFYVKDVSTGQFWSIGHQPALRPGRRYEVIFSQARAEFRRVDGDFVTHMEIAVSPEDDIELRRISITNRSWSTRTIELTSYAEVVLDQASSDATHPAFSKLFVQTEILKQRQAIICTRRPRSEKERGLWFFHLVTIHGEPARSVTYETDRMKFLGRGRTPAEPVALERELSNSQGPVLDPIVAIRCHLTLEPDETRVVDFISGVATERDKAELLLERYHDPDLASRVFSLAWTHSQVVLHQLNTTEADAQLYGRLAGSIVYGGPQRRAPAGILLRSRGRQSALWAYGISGDLPIVLVRISDASRVELIRQILQAHGYWQAKGLKVDLVIWNEETGSYRQQLHDLIMNILAGFPNTQLDTPGGVFVRRIDQMTEEDRLLMQAAARIILQDSRGLLPDQISYRATAELPPLMIPEKSRRLEAGEGLSRRKDLEFATDYGGFTANGREYVIHVWRRRLPPAPWVNVIANQVFGTVVSESGSAYTWAENAHEFRLTPWYNDPVSDVSGEVVYLRDEKTGYFWSATPLPAGGPFLYRVTHGFGYTVYEYQENFLHSQMWVFIAPDMPIKFFYLKLDNNSSQAMRLSATIYVEWILGQLRSQTAMHVSTEVDSRTGAILARNHYNIEFANRVVFLDAGEAEHEFLERSVTGDRTEFLGRNGTPVAPEAMKRERLSGRTGAGFDPCGAVQVFFDLEAQESKELVFVLGSGHNLEQVRSLLLRYRNVAAARSVLKDVQNRWRQLLSAVRVETPDLALNIMANGWLLYQTLACRFFGRSAFYQSSGAYGFRDQLQDVMALVHATPSLVRRHLLRCASRQFREGDVQHWWHPRISRGVRTRISDDLLWLPLATSRYIATTGDREVLGHQVHYLVGRPLGTGEIDYYDLPYQSEETGSLYEHCRLAIRRACRFGPHGLPLMGSGDWNDGMNMVGIEGKGESVWLGFFLYHVLMEFAPVAEEWGDKSFAEECRQIARNLQENIEKHGWDGKWYRRAYFDNGQVLGSSVNEECQIDSLPQSWAVLSRAAGRQRAILALSSVEEYLVDEKAGLIRLLFPPFDRSHLNPGYIKGYVPGVRENGGQYNHAACWVAMALAHLGEADNTWKIFRLLHPIYRSETTEKAERYAVEPYVMAGDIYAVSPHTGKGGWTWYTGASGWMYQLILESLLGLRRKGQMIEVVPCVPENWLSYKIHYRFGKSIYHLDIIRKGPGSSVKTVLLDNQFIQDKAFPLQDDGKEHQVEIHFG